MSLSLNTLRLLQALLLNQTLSLGADNGEIQAALIAKEELAKAIAEYETS